MTVPDLAVARVRRFCATRVPADLADQIRVESTVRGNAITILECRPPWHPDETPEWSRLAIAQLRFDANAKTWSVFWQRANGRWLRFDEQPPSTDIDELLATIEENPYGVFWG